MMVQYYDTRAWPELKYFWVLNKCRSIRDCPAHIMDCLATTRVLAMSAVASISLR